MEETKSSLVVAERLPKHIKKGHQLIFSRQDLSAREADLFALMIAHMSPLDWQQNTPVFEFTADQLSKWLKIKPKHVGSNLEPVVERLMARKVGVKTQDAEEGVEFDYVNLFKRIRYTNRKLTMMPNDILKNEYIAYHQGFALINTKSFFELKKEYTKRLYELLSRFKRDGTNIQPQKIEELKGLFGILDEKGRLKADKKSFKNTSVFMQRCIRDSIAEIEATPLTNKEIIFLRGKSNQLGYEPVKRGNRIVAIEFLYRWIEDTSVESLNIQDAKKNVRELELKRLQTGTRLSLSELQLLSSSYLALNKTEHHRKVEDSIAQRLREDESVIEESDTAEDDIDSMLEKIAMLEAETGQSGY